MPWCPNCKAEYVAGKTVCIDCGTELIEDIEVKPGPVVFLETVKEKLALKFVQFLHYSKIDSATCEFKEESQKWIVLVNDSDLKQTEKLYKAFYTVETTEKLSEFKEDISNSEDTSDEFMDDDVYANQETDDENELSDSTNEDSFDDSMFDKEELQKIIESTKEIPEKPATYVKKEDQYNDLQSSGVTFIVVSVLGLIVLILNAIGVMHFINGLLPYIVMGGLFIAFIIIGISSFASAKRVKIQAGEENRLTESINTWLTQNVTIELLDSATQDETNEEIRFFHKLEKMKQMIEEQFGELDDSYLDNLVEEYYNNHFEK